jgi:hypothetical protein
MNTPYHLLLEPQDAVNKKGGRSPLNVYFINIIFLVSIKLFAFN